MLWNKGFMFKSYKWVHNKKVRILWGSQKKQFGKIGKGSSVLELPYINGYENICIGDNFHCGKDVRIEAWSCYGNQTFTPKIVIGNNVIFTDRCYLSCVDKIEIGDGVLFGRDVFVTDNSHGDSSTLNFAPLERELTSKGSVVIGKNVWICRQVTILSGVTIGDNSIIGANSVVNKDIPSNCIAVGSPAEVVKIINLNE